LSQNSEKERVCFKQAGEGRTYKAEGTMQKDTSSKMNRRMVNSMIFKYYLWERLKLLSEFLRSQNL